MSPNLATIPFLAPTVRGSLLLILLLGIGGCAWQTQNRLDRYDQSYNSGRFSEAAELAGEFGDSAPESDVNTDLLWALQQASALQAAGDHESAIRQFDATEAYFRRYDERGALLEWGDQLLSVLTNEAALDYQGTVYDAIMVNSYKALNFLAAGQPELARVELNRARDRQRRATDYFSAELAEARQKLIRGGSSSGAGQGAVQQALSHANQSLAADYRTLSEWSIYPDFINPLATYLHGLFLLTHAEAAGDYGLAADALKQVHGMVPELGVAAEDWQWAEALASGERRLEDLPPTVWVLYENGLGPVRAVERIHLPIFLFNRDGVPFWAGIAYPRLEPRRLAQPHVTAELPGAGSARSETLVDMDAVIGAEFAQRLPPTITRAVVAAVTKAVAQYQVQRETHPLVALLGLAYQVASTQADTRQWTSLPKAVQVAKLERTPDSAGLPGPGQLMLSGSRSQLVDLPDTRFTLVWVRQPTPGASPAVTVIPLGKTAVHAGDRL